MMRRWYVRAGIGGTALAALVVAGTLLFVALGGPSEQRVAIFFLINLVIVVGLQLFMGNAHVTNFGHISFMGIGAFATAILTVPTAIKVIALPDAPFGLRDVELTPLVGGVAAIAIALLIAFVTGLVISRLTGMAASIASLALLFIVHTLLLNWEDLTRGSRVLYGVPIETTQTWALGAAVVVIVLARLFRDSPPGVQLRASGDDPLAAAAMGIGVRRLRLVAWTLSGGMVAVGGVLYALFLGSVSPDSFWLHATFLTIAMLLLGGLGSVSGAVLGTVFVTAGFELMRWLEGGPVIFGWNLPELVGLSDVFLGLVIILTMALRPTGLVGDDELDESLSRRIRKPRRRRTDAVSEPAVSARAPSSSVQEPAGSGIGVEAG